MTCKMKILTRSNSALKRNNKIQKFYEKMGEERVLLALQLKEVGHLTKESHSPL